MNEAPLQQTARFVRSLPEATAFAAAISGEHHIRLPDDWFIAVTDVVGSRQEIARGRYKAVNMAGVALITAAMNALSSQEIPFIFGGDGAALAVAPDAAEILRAAMASLLAFAAEDLDLELRASLVPVSAVRADGFDVLVERVRLSDAVSNYAFTGGGVSHAEKLMKEGKYRVEKAAPGSRPDLTGLSCRWTPISSAKGLIVSIIVEPADGVAPEEFAREVGFLTAIEAEESTGPMPAAGPEVGWPASGMDLEARAARGQGSYLMTRIKLLVETAFAWFLFKSGISFGGFEPERYRRYTSLNTDFRKVQDGLRMTLALSRDELANIEERLEKLRENQILRYGLFSQESAVLTCYTPSVTRDDHFHFLDGAGGGYAAAASNMRA